MATSEKPGQIFWDPVTGCKFIDNDCKGCYARSLSGYRHTIGNPLFSNGFQPNVHPEQLLMPTAWKYRHFIHVANNSDIFLDSFSDNDILRIFKVMNDTPNSVFLVQTKNSARLLQMSSKILWTENIWMGVTVTQEKYISRIDDLRNTSARIKWIAFQPLKKEINKVDLHGIDWVVVGPVKFAQRIDLYNQRKQKIIIECKRLRIPFYDKNRYEFREYGRFKKNKFPQDLMKLGVLSKDRHFCSIIYYDSRTDSIKTNPFYGDAGKSLKDLQQFLSKNIRKPIIGLSAESGYHIRLEQSMRMIADVRNVTLLAVVKEFLKYSKKFKYDPMVTFNNLQKISPLKKREILFPKTRFALAIAYSNYASSIANK